MDKEVLDQYIHEKYQPALAYYMEKARSYRRTYVQMQWSILVLSGLNAFLIGLQTLFDWTLIRIITFLISVVISVLAGAFKAFDYQGKWTAYNQIVTNLRYEYDMHMAEAGEYSQASDKDKLFIAKVSALMREVSGDMPNITVPLRHD
jgi:hypothetical protein